MTVNVSVHWSWLLSAWGLLFLDPNPALACSCQRDPDPIAAATAASAVFEGLVEEVAEVDGGERRVTFSVVRAFKGANQERIVIQTDPATHPCANPFRPQEGYLVFANGEHGQALTVPACSRTLPSAQAAADFQALGPGSIPVDIEPAAPPDASPDGEGGQDRAGSAASDADKAIPRPRGGCASCSTSTGSTRPALPLALLVGIGLLWRRARRRP